MVVQEEELEGVEERWEMAVGITAAGKGVKTGEDKKEVVNWVVGKGVGKLVEAAKEADTLYELSKSCQCHKIYDYKFHTIDGCSQ